MALSLQIFSLQNRVAELILYIGLDALSTVVILCNVLNYCMYVECSIYFNHMHIH